MGGQDSAGLITFTAPNYSTACTAARNHVIGSHLRRQSTFIECQGINMSMEKHSDFWE